MRTHQQQSRSQGPGLTLGEPAYPCSGGPTVALTSPSSNQTVFYKPNLMTTESILKPRCFLKPLSFRRFTGLGRGVSGINAFGQEGLGYPRLLPFTAEATTSSRMSFTTSWAPSSRPIPRTAKYKDTRGHSQGRQRKGRRLQQCSSEVLLPRAEATSPMLWQTTPPET